MKRIKNGIGIVVMLLTVFIAFNYNSGTPVEKLKEKYTYPESKFFPFDGMQVHYRVTGSGPALVLLHGVASSLQTWEGWHRELSDDFTVISFDVPGFGLTGPNPSGDYSVNMYMELMDGLLNKLNIDSCYMAGNSYGGYLTWNYALHDPERVKKIILIDAAGYNANREIDNPGFKLAINPLTKNISHRITPYFVVKKSVEDVYGNKLLVTEQTVRRYYDLILRKGNREAFSEILINLHNGSVNPLEINGINQPALIMWGTDDRLIDPKDAVSFEEAIDNSTLIIYPGIGHIPMEEIPEITANDAKKFLMNQ
jgi:pimeloyl-ACP methyl ester carboxylesterase